MSRLLFVFLLGSSVAVWAQNSSPQNSSPSNTAPGSAPTPDSASSQDSKPAKPALPNLAPPRSDHVNADELGDEPGESSSKDTQVDLSPPPDDAKVHPQSSDILMDAETAPGNGDVSEFHPWDPHKATKDIEVGDFYFKRKNYHAAEDRYREALYYKNNDAVATFRLAVCLEKQDQPDEARKEYESYLKILPHGPEAEAANKAIARLKSSAAKAAK
ncbi:MAG TPA: tetratricopeptide repeat protein [Candidatus Sulfotelmatobacter sp.]|nr:tetratricopeptide repeat protein [Candidatus Sulfotelmatobacter sp.]